MSDTMTDAEHEAYVASTEAAMRDAGVATHEPVYEDYFGCDQTFRVMLPDGRQYVEHKEFTEGGRRKYLNSTNRDVVVQRATGDAKMRMAPGDERFQLLKNAICGWHLIRDGVEYPFNDRNLNEFLDKAPPKIIDMIEKDVRDKNAWLQADVSIEDIDKEIEQLQEQRQKKVDEEAGKSASGRK